MNSATATTRKAVAGQAGITAQAQRQQQRGSTRPSHALEFDPALMEAVATRALAAGTPAAAGFTQDAFHAEADPLYRLRDVEQRSLQFRTLFARWFRRGQFDVPFADALAEMPDVAAHVARVTVVGAASRAEERADLAVTSGMPLTGTPGEHWLGISIQPCRVLDRPLLRRWLRHEMWHVRDMLDPAFDYRREDLIPNTGPADRLPQRVVQDRYALLWSLAIDARIERAGLLPLHSTPDRLTRLAQAFPAVSEKDCQLLVESIGVTRGVRHPELLDLARSPRRLVGDECAAGAASGPVTGSPCPLCRFPTFQWADLRQPTAEPIIELIRQAYGDWDPSQGICTTCFDLFSIRSGVWA